MSDSIKKKIKSQEEIVANLAHLFKRTEEQITLEKSKLRKLQLQLCEETRISNLVDKEKTFKYILEYRQVKGLEWCSAGYTTCQCCPYSPECHPKCALKALKEAKTWAKTNEGKKFIKDNKLTLKELNTTLRNNK